MRVAGNVLSARAGKPAGGVHPPTFTACNENGPELEFGVVSSRFSPDKSMTNLLARDEFVAK